MLLKPTANGQAKSDELLEQLFLKNNDSTVQKVANNPDRYRCQVIYTQINRNKDNIPSFKNYYFNYNPDNYFNPASMVKMPLAFLALEKLNAMNVKSVNKHTPILFDSSYAGQKTLYTDSTAKSRLPSIAHFIKKAFLISDNDAYNRLYQFVGQQTINRQLHNKGYDDARITRQFMGFTDEQNRHTNPVRFIKKNGKIIYTQRAAYNKDSFDYRHNILIGKAHYNMNDILINEPFNFTRHNNLSLEDFQQILQSVLFPSSVKDSRRFNLSTDDYNFLYRYLSQFPSETSYPKHDTSRFYDSYVKFFFRNKTHKMPDNIRVFNKVGWAYGFITDVSYVVDYQNKVEYMLAATLYVNSDDILNDNKYDYETIGWPFLYELGQSVYQYELKRERTFKPNLSRFEINYEKRDPNDSRPAIFEADN